MRPPRLSVCACARCVLCVYMLSSFIHGRSWRNPIRSTKRAGNRAAVSTKYKVSVNSAQMEKSRMVLSGRRRRTHICMYKYKRKQNNKRFSQIVGKNVLEMGTPRED